MGISLQRSRNGLLDRKPRPYPRAILGIFFSLVPAIVVLLTACGKEQPEGAATVFSKTQRVRRCLNS